MRLVPRLPPGYLYEVGELHQYTRQVQVRVVRERPEWRWEKVQQITQWQQGDRSVFLWCGTTMMLVWLACMRAWWAARPTWRREAREARRVTAIKPYQGQWR